MKRKFLIIYLFIFTLLYLVMFMFMFSSNESFGSLKKVVLINGLLNLGILLIDKKNVLLLFHPLLFFITSYMSIMIYMFCIYWMQSFLSVDNIIYPFTSGKNGFLFTYGFTLIIWIIIIIIEKIKKRK